MPWPLFLMRLLSNRVTTRRLWRKLKQSAITSCSRSEKGVSDRQTPGFDPKLRSEVKVKVGAGEQPDSGNMTSIGAQCQGAIWFDLLPAGPCDGIAHVLNFNFSPQFETLPLDSLWQHELRLANFTRQWIAGI